ncbi:MAG: PTS sugar transporter subunit IIA [Sedimentisphaerales bacterium]|nr:PTS sugar transporter subunit IIA [Sedimentisphaerales bacterium]
MKLADIVCFDALLPQLKATTRDEAITELVEALQRAGCLGKTQSRDIVKAVIKRENEASTGIGKGVAVPHVKHPSLKEIVAAVGRSEKGIDFVSLDKQPVYSVILLLSPTDNADKHLQAMETIFGNLNKEDFRRFLRHSQTVDQIRETILDADDGIGG